MKTVMAIGAVAAGALMLTAWALCAVGKELEGFQSPYTWEVPDGEE